MEKSKVNSILSTAFTWAVIGLMFIKEPVPSILLGIGAGVAMFARYARRYHDLLIRGAGWGVASLAFLLYTGSHWYKWFFVGITAWVAVSYVLAYLLRVMFDNDFIERKFLAFLLVGAVFSFLLAYPTLRGALRFLILLTMSGLILYLTYAVSTYVSAHLSKKSRVEPLPLPSGGVREDYYSRELGRVIEAFVEKGDKVPLTVFLIRNAPEGLAEAQLREIVRPIVEYAPPRPSSLLPPWVVEKRLDDERLKRLEILRKTLRRLGFSGVDS